MALVTRHEAEEAGSLTLGAWHCKKTQVYNKSSFSNRCECVSRYVKNSANCQLQDNTCNSLVHVVYVNRFQSTNMIDLSPASWRAQNNALSKFGIPRLLSLNFEAGYDLEHDAKQL